MAPEPKDLHIFSKFARNDASMKVWLPLMLTDRLDWISKREDVSRSDVIRALMFDHLYGRAAYMALLENDARRRRATADDTRMSRERSSGIDAELIGKPTDNLRLELPQQLKADLANVARVYRDWQVAIGKIGPDVERLERSP